MAEIVIHFTIEGGGNAVPTPEEEEQNTTQQAEDVKEQAFQVDVARSIAKKFATMAFNATLSTMGARTGNYIQQERIETAINYAQKAINIGVAFATTGVVGGLVALATEAVSTGVQVANFERDVRWKNREAYQVARRAGYNSNYNR